MTTQTLFEKVWSRHVVQKLAPDVDLLYIDRHLMHDLGGGDAIFQVRHRGLKVRQPGLTFATPDHVVSTEPGRTGGMAPWADDTIAKLRQQTHETGIHLFDVSQTSQGIIHVIGPEQGVSLPGTTIVCGDSHTCTHGALGAIAFGIGITEVQHVLASPKDNCRHGQVHGLQGRQPRQPAKKDQSARTALGAERLWSIGKA